METTKLCDSCFCRLCAEENKNGTYLFPLEDDQDNISLLINKYLPVKVEKDNKYPNRICPGCHIQLEATKLFMDLIVEGQSKLRNMYRKEQETLMLQEKHKQQLQDALQVVSPKSTVTSYTIQANEEGVLQSLIEIFSDGPLFPADHQLSLLSEGIEKPRRKRGRPPKQIIEPTGCEGEEKNDKKEEETFEGDGRRKRKIRPPSKFDGVIQGKELDKMLQEEGIEEKVDDITNASSNIIGRIEFEDSKESGQPVYLHKQKNVKTSKPSYQCEICKRHFLHFGRFQIHMNTVHKVLSCTAPGCSFVTKEKDALEEHQQEIGHMSKDLNEGSSSQNHTNDEQNRIPKGDFIKFDQFTYTCAKCLQHFTSALDLELHGVEHQDDKSDTVTQPKNGLMKPYSCADCHKNFQNPSSLLYHKETEHNKGKRYVCNRCPKSFKLRQQLLRHQKVHSEERPFPCPNCTATFKTQSNLLNHQIIHTGEKKFCCTLCGKRFPHKTSLTLHMRWHDGEKPFQCQVCLKSFTQKGNLTEHVRIHTGEKPFCCDQCGRSFTTSSQFHLHMKRHTGEKPWVCDYCSKSFLHKDTFKAHVRRHLNERPFKCKTCMRSFPESWALRRHQRIHTKERPYSCPICDKTFADSSNRLKHLKIHTSAKLFKHTNSSVQVPGSNIKMILMPKSTNGENPSANMQLTQLYDTQGHPISIITADGQTIPVVTEGDDNILKGLLPDGTLVPIDWDKDLMKEKTEPTDILELNEGEIVSLNESDIVNNEEQSLDTNIQNIQFMMGDDGQEMCLITYGPLDENEPVIDTELNSSLFLTTM